MISIGQVHSYRDIPGWFAWDDHALFEAILESQHPKAGTLVELGVYLGRSAVVIGAHQGPDDRFVVIDLFGSEAELAGSSIDSENRRENRNSYPALTRAAFEQNYLSLHSRLPEIVHGLSSSLLDHVTPGTARFIHVDASHRYARVAEDVRLARTALASSGVIVLDDYREIHTPGVAAAAWAAVCCSEMVPFVITPKKMYATWGDPGAYLEVVEELVRSNPRLSADEQEILGHRVIRLQPLPAPRLSVENLRASTATAMRPVVQRTLRGRRIPDADR